MQFADKFRKRMPIIVSLAVLAIMALVWQRDSYALLTRFDDRPPVIDFTWTPLEPTDLRDLRGFLTMKDDYALDFKTYRMRVAELDKEWELPIDGLLGKEYEQPISLGLIADKPQIIDAGQVTLQFSIADDRGQKTLFERVIRLQKP